MEDLKKEIEKQATELVERKATEMKSIDEINIGDVQVVIDKSKTYEEQVEDVVGAMATAQAVKDEGTKLYKHTITGFIGGTSVIDILSITLISTSNAKITSASALDLQYTQYGISANTAYGKVVNIVQTMTDEITMQFHSRPAGGEVETVELDASNITDNVEAL